MLKSTFLKKAQMYIRQLTDSVRNDRESYIREHKGEKTQLINCSNKNNTTPCCICKSQFSLSGRQKPMQRASPDYRKWVLLMETTMEQHQVLKSDQWELTELRLPGWQVTRIRTGGGQQQVTGDGAAASHSPRNAALGMTRGATVNAASPSRSTTVNAWY